MSQLLVTDCDENCGGVHLLDSRTGRRKRVFSQPSRGITRTPDGFYIVDNDGVIYRLNPETWESQRLRETNLGGCHDLRWLGDGFALVAAQGNRIVRLAQDLSDAGELRLIEDDADVCHANCLVEWNGEHLLSIFTLVPGARAQKNRTPAWRTEGKVLRLDWERNTFDIWYEPLCQPHSLIPHGGRLYCCESFTSEVASIDPVAKVKQTHAQLKGFARGLAFAGGKAYVGISYWRRKNMTAWQKLIEPITRWSGVVELDTQTWEITRRYKFPSRQIYEVLTLDESP
jgi:hypothetical protein